MSLINTNKVDLSLVHDESPSNVTHEQLWSHKQNLDFVLFDQIKNSLSVSKRHPGVITDRRDVRRDFLDLVDHQTDQRNKHYRHPWLKDREELKNQRLSSASVEVDET